VNVLKPVLLLLSLLNYTVPQDQAARLFCDTEFIFEYDEDLTFYENGVSTDPVQTGGYRLCYFDNDIQCRLVFYNDKPLVCSIKIADCNSYLREIEAIDTIALMLGHKSETYYFLANETPYYVKHVYLQEITFIIFDSWVNDDHDKIWLFTGSRHPLEYVRPGSGGKNE
jgi:hypothetical protein